MKRPSVRVDPLIVLILGAVIVAIFMPIAGDAARYFSIATKIAIAVLFFLYGARLSPHEALNGLKHWRLHLTILAFTFLIFPLIGVSMYAFSSFIPAGLLAGLVYLTLVPSTVQSSIAFTSISGGNVAGAIVSASISNLLGVVLTPVLVLVVMSQGSGVHIDGQVFIDIAVQLLLPFVLGQLLRPWVKGFAANKATKIVDRGSITMVVYSAFSAGMVNGVWTSVSLTSIVALVVFAVLLVAVMLWFTKFVALKLGFSEADAKAIQFCGTKKSLATGLPMAAVIFAGQSISLLILPLMIFHQIQLMMCSWLAGRYATQLEKQPL